MRETSCVAVRVTAEEYLLIRRALYHVLYGTDYCHLSNWELDEEKHLHIRSLWLTMEETVKKQSPSTFREPRIIEVDTVTYRAVLYGVKYLTSLTTLAPVLLSPLVRKLSEHELSVAVLEAFHETF